MIIYSLARNPSLGMSMQWKQIARRSIIYRPSLEAFHILEADPYSWGPNLADIGTFAVHVST